MTTYRGNLDGIRRGRLQGWAVNVERATDRANVVALANGEVVAVARADQPREDLRQLGIGDGAYGFDINLASVLSGRRDPVEIDVLIGTEGWSPPGSPFTYLVPASGCLDFWREGALVGWAHGESYAQARIEVFRNDKFLLAWPADVYREDLARLNFGDGRHGFSIPIDMFVDGGLQDLTFRIEGTAEVLPPPKIERQGTLETPSTLSEGFRTAAEARGALLAALTASNNPKSTKGCVRLSFAAIQTLLGELSYAANRKEDEEARAALRLHPRLPSTTPRKGVGRGAAKYARLLDKLARDHGEDRKTRIRDQLISDLLPHYAAHPDARPQLDALASRVNDVGVLEAMVDVFRSRNYLSMPAAAFGAILAQTPNPTSRQFLQLRQMASWASCIDFDDIPGRPQIPAEDRTRRALYVTWSSLPYDQNGYCTRTHYLLKAFRDIGEQVVGVTRLGYPWDNANRQPPADYIETIEGVTYVHLGGDRANRRFLTLEAYIRECADRIAQVAAMLRVDVIHSASNWMVGLPALLAARQSGLPFCYELRGVWEITRASNNPGYEHSDHFRLFHAMEGLVAREADAVLAITSQVRAEMESRGVDASKVELAPNGVDIARFFPRAKDAELMTQLGLGDEIAFGFIGSFAPYEGLMDVCRAAVRLRDRGIRFKMLLVGDGEAFADVKAYCVGQGLESFVLLPGRVPFTEVPRYYSVMDVSLCPRLPVAVTEIVSPLKPFEAMAMAKPVVGSDVAAVAEIIDDGRTGWLFRKGDLDSFVEVLARLAGDRPAIAEVGAAARAVVEQRHQWTMVAGRIVGAWDKLRRPSGPGEAAAAGGEGSRLRVET